jgi:arabinogalactan endo-1,4-beta-galactosidase
MKNSIIVCLFCITISCSKSPSPSPTPIPTPTPTPVATTTYRGADLSFLTEIEQSNTSFYDSGTAKPVLTIFKNNGCNLVRVRLWYNPSTAHSGLAEVLGFCQRIKQSGMDILLDFHYSDTWADPSTQTTPASWAALSFATLQDSVFQYTRRVITLLQNQNTMPAIVQVGNEINTGILWNLGKLSSWTDPNLSNFTTLLSKAIAGVKAVDTNNSISIMLHYAGPSNALGFFNLIKQQGVTYDMIGLSYYPWWHGTDITALQQSLNTLATTFARKIMIVETAYPFTLQWNDNTNNIVGTTNQLITGYDATQAGQLTYLQQLKTILLAVPNSLGVGFCYWEPDWVAFKGPTATNGSTWENLALFDFQNKSTIALQAFK